VYDLSVSRRKKRKPQRRTAAQAPVVGAAPRVVVREAAWVERLAYTQTQAAQALGISRSSFYRRVLPFVEVVEIGSGARLIPVDELERILAERRRAARRSPGPRVQSGRPASLPAGVVERIRAERKAGRSLAQIARDLDADGVPTAHGGSRWWPSTVRAVLCRSE
jgi:hypothetical protein